MVETTANCPASTASRQYGLVLGALGSLEVAIDVVGCATGAISVVSTDAGIGLRAILTVVVLAKGGGTMQDAMSIEREAVERWNAHDREGYLALFDEKVSFTDAAMSHELIGREEFGKGFFDVWAEAYPDNQIKQTLVFTDGTWICFEGRFTGTHTGTFHGPEIEMPPTGKSIDGPYVWLAEVREGKIKRARIYYDRLLTLEQEGVVSVKEFAAQLTPA